MLQVAMQTNLVSRGIPSRRFHTAPHSNVTEMEYHPAAAYTAPIVNLTPQEPPRRTNSGGSMNSLGDRNSAPQTEGGYLSGTAYTDPVRNSGSGGYLPGTVYRDPMVRNSGSGGYQSGNNRGNSSSYQPQQPHSFPQPNPQGANETRPFRSMEGFLDQRPPTTRSAPPHMHHPQSSSSSAQQWYPDQPHYSTHTSPPQQPGSPNPAAFHDHLHSNYRPTVGAQGRTHSDTALTVTPHPFIHPTGKSNSQHTLSQVPQTSESQRFAPRTTEASALLQRSAPVIPTQQYANAIPHFISKSSCSQATLENARYSLDLAPMADHPNEDRHFALEGPNFKVFGVFDGHDGPRAAGFASNYMMQLFDTPSWNSIVKHANPSVIHEALAEFFRATEKDFFKSIQRYIDEKEVLQKRIPSGLSSYAAFQQYPREVARLQEIEPKLSGGCTAVLALIVNDRLYVANSGDSRAVLAQVQPNGTVSVEQLSVDHSVENEEELKRLEALGLDPRQLIKAGRLGMHENTRSIGDYSIKQGYKDVDTLRSARSAPGIVTPYIMPTKTINHTYQYLILMTDGVYKSLESTFDQKHAIDPNKVVFATIERSLRTSEGRFDHVSDSVLARVAQIHKDCYEKHAKVDTRSPLAVSCRKRDDMTLLVYRFPDTRSLN